MGLGQGGLVLIAWRYNEHLPQRPGRRLRSGTSDDESLDTCIGLGASLLGGAMRHGVAYDAACRGRCVGDAGS
jgi:hypothetical protein